MRYVAFRMKCLNTTRGAHESNAEVTSYTHENLTPDTTYYILVPNGNPDLTQGIRGTRDSGDTIPNSASCRKVGLVPHLLRFALFCPVMFTTSHNAECGGAMSS